MSWHDILPPEQRALLAKFTWVERALELCAERDALAQRVKALEAAGEQLKAAVARRQFKTIGDFSALAAWEAAK